MKRFISNPQSLLKRALNQPVKIFISYRRDDTAGYAGHLAADLSNHFGEDSIFIDIDMERGKDFVEVIQDEISSSSVLIAVIGKQWATTLDNTRSLGNPDDYVRLEITIALEQNVQIVPILVHGATMPNPNLLPPELAKITRLNAFQLNGIRWRDDVNQLIKILDKAIKEWQENRKKEIEDKRQEEHRKAIEEKRQAKISTLLARAEQATVQEDWMIAINNLERVLRLDAYNQDALLKLKQVNQQRKEKLTGANIKDGSSITGDAPFISDQIKLFIRQHLLSLSLASIVIFLGMIWIILGSRERSIVNPPDIIPTSSPTIQVFPKLLSQAPLIGYEDLFSQSVGQTKAPFTGSKIRISGTIRGCEDDPTGKFRVYFGVHALTGEMEREPGQRPYSSRLGKYKEPSGIYCLFDERPALACEGSNNEAILMGTVDGKIANNIIIKDCSVLRGND